MRLFAARVIALIAFGDEMSGAMYTNTLAGVLGADHTGLGSELATRIGMPSEQAIAAHGSRAAATAVGLAVSVGAITELFPACRPE